MDQMMLNIATEAEQAAKRAVSSATKIVGDVFRYDIRVRSTYEGYGLLAERSAVLKGEIKQLQKAMDLTIGTLESGAETPKMIADVEFIAESLAEQAILMAAKAKICIDYLTCQARVVDPETGEIEE